jgi:hypothetical protein
MSANCVDYTEPYKISLGNVDLIVLDSAITTPLTGLEIAGMKVANGLNVDRFGFMTIEPDLASGVSDGWLAKLRDVNSATQRVCMLSGGGLICNVMLPLTGQEAAGSDRANTEMMYALLAVAAGAALMFIGLALSRRRARRI